MLLPIDVYRYHSIDIGLSIVVIFYLISQTRRRIIQAILIGLIVLYSCLSILREIDLYRFLEGHNYAKQKLIKIISRYPQKQVCTNDLNLPWVLINNPIAGIPQRASEFLEWKKCKIICIREGNQWKVKLPDEE